MWREEQFEFHLKDFRRDAVETMVGLARAARGEMNAFSNVLNSARRLDTAIDYAFRNDTYPGSVILAIGDHGYEIIDGYHRLTALWHVQDMHARNLRRMLRRFKPVTMWSLGSCRQPCAISATGKGSAEEARGAYRSRGVLAPKVSQPASPRTGFA